MRGIPTVIIPALLSLVVLGCVNSELKKLCIRDTCIFVEVADTPEARRQGLMYRKGLAPNRGMLFVFEDEGIHGMWMKNMQFPIDIIWFDADKKIVDITENALPCKDICPSIIPPVPTKYALEVVSGFVNKFRLAKGDVLR